MARRSTVGSVTGAIIDSMAVVSNATGMLSDFAQAGREVAQGAIVKAQVFNAASKIDAQIELGKMKSEKVLEAKINLGKQKAEVVRLLQTDKELAAVWDEVDTEVNSWFN